MLPLVTAQEMKAIDRRAIEEWGINGLVLMENAGRAVVDWIEKELTRVDSQKFLVVCGKGNNGGDGFVITRHLLNRGAKPACVLLGSLNDLKGDARTNARILLDAGFPIQEIKTKTDLTALINPNLIIVDAIFGTGLTAPPAGIFAEAIQLINQSNLPVVSVDIPSGIDADNGQVLAPAVKAHLTVTMCLPKLGLFLYPGKLHAGKVRIADIGIPYHLLKENSRTWLVEENDIRANLPLRPPDGHKGTFGTCAIIAGSRGYSGAACLAAMAAVRAGAGLVRLAYPQGLTSIIESRVAEPVKHPLPETEQITLSTSAFEPVKQIVADASAILIGPGISTHPETKELLFKLIPHLKKPAVLDADALNNLAGALEILKHSDTTFILTPHPGELSRLIGKGATEINADRVNIARAFAREHNCILVLKGAPTVIAAPDDQVYLNPTGNSGLASGGTGDVLAGLIAGLLAQGASPLNAAIIGVFLHGRAADIAASELTEYCLAAGDLVDFLPRAFSTIVHN